MPRVPSQSHSTLRAAVSNKAKAGGAPLVPVSRMEELSCFLPGNLALGIMTGAVKGERAELYRAAAQNLTYTCWQMYDRMPTGASAPQCSQPFLRPHCARLP